MIDRRRTVAFVPFRSFSVDQQLATAEYLVAKGGYDCHFLLVKHSLPTMERIRAAGFQYTCLVPPPREPGLASAAPSAVAMGRRVATPGAARVASAQPRGGALRRAAWLARELAQAVYVVLRDARALRRARRAVEATLAPMDLYCAILSEERTPRLLPLLTTLRARRVPMVFLPAADSAPDGSAQGRRNNVRLTAGIDERVRGASPLTVWLNRMVARRYPAQVYRAPWVQCLFLSAPETLGLQLAGMPLRNPWCQGANFADYTVVGALDEAALCEQAGLGRDRILFFGTHDHDRLYEQWLARDVVRRAATERYGLSPGRPIVVVALPVLGETDMVASEEAYWNGIHELLGAVCGPDREVLVSLHPRMAREAFAWLEEKYPLRLCVERLHDLLGIADAFVATFSSTVKWAIGLGIPTINADLWNLRFDYYRPLPGHRLATTAGQVCDCLEMALRDPAGYFAPGRVYQPGRENGVAVDGRSKERLLAFLWDLPSR